MVRSALLLVLAALAFAAVGCGDDTTDGGSEDRAGGAAGADEGSVDTDDLPPPISRAEGRRLKRGTTKRPVFARFGESDYAEGPSPATFNVGAERCYTYRVPGTEREGTEEEFADGETVYDSWWLCFDERDRLVHKGAPDGDESPLG